MSEESNKPKWGGTILAELGCVIITLAFMILAIVWVLYPVLN